jgi:hypothetical protein
LNESARESTQSRSALKEGSEHGWSVHYIHEAGSFVPLVHLIWGDLPVKVVAVAEDALSPLLESPFAEIIPAKFIRLTLNYECTEP